MSNSVTLAQLAGMPGGEVEALPIDMLAMLLEDVAAAKAFAKECDEKLSAALHRRFGEFAQQSRRVLNKDAGRVRWDESDEYAVVADLPVIIDWSQPEMAKAAEVVRSWGEPEDDYFTTTRKCAELKFKSLPASIRKVFEPARTVRTGKPSYELVRKEAA